MVENQNPRWVRRSEEAMLERWPRILLEQRLRAEARGRQVASMAEASDDGLIDIRLAGPGEPMAPAQAFARLRWGGLVGCISPDMQHIAALARQYDRQNGFVLEQPLDSLWAGPRGLRIPGVTPRGYFFLARKTSLIRPGCITDRFTYSVHLQRHEAAPLGYIVRKQIPDLESLVRRLRKRFAHLDEATITARAHWLINEVFPVFLTREARVLEALQRTLPEALRCRVPRALGICRNDAGHVTQLDMNWLRTGGPVLCQVQFARQSAQLLAALHEQARIMHLDLRLDNCVITPDGVGFVDFGSAAHMDEDLNRSPLLKRLFSEVMRTSRVHKALGQMLERGEVTNQQIAAVHGKVDKAVDGFYLAVQITNPHANPELTRMIRYHPDSEAGKALAALAASVLRPKNPAYSHLKTASDMLRGIARIEHRLERGSSSSAIAPRAMKLKARRRGAAPTVAQG